MSNFYIIMFYWFVSFVVCTLRASCCNTLCILVDTELCRSRC